MPLLTAHPGMTHRPQQPMGQKGQAVMQYLDDVASGRIAEQGMRQYGDAVRAGMGGDYKTFGGLLGDAMGGGFLAHGLMGMPGMIGHTVYHGSPHKWDVPDISKVGTGEGAQAYGHGFYSAEADDVAENYRKQLTERSGPEGAAAYMQRMYKDNALDHAKSQAEMPNLSPSAKKFAQEAYEVLKRGDINQGHLYKLDIPDEDVAKYLDWDKPLSEQSEGVQKALGGILDGELAAHKRWIEIRDEMDNIWESAGGASGLDSNHALAKKWRDLGEEAETLTDKYSLVTFPDDIDTFNSMRGEDLHSYIQKFGDQQEAADELQSLGIPGIRYFDGSSRAAGEGTSNFVTFDPSRIKVLERK